MAHHDAELIFKYGRWHINLWVRVNLRWGVHEPAGKGCGEFLQPRPQQEGHSEMDGELQGLQGINESLENATEEFLRHLATLERELAGEVLAMWGAFVHFCEEELLLEPEKLLKVWSESMLPRIEKLKNIPDPPEVNQKVFKEYIAALEQMWSSLIQPA